jgi:hypothetical protein
MSQFTGQLTGQTSQYSQGVYGRFGYAAIPNADISVNPDRRGLDDRTFYWDPTEPTEWIIPVTGAGTNLEVTETEFYEIGITPDLGWANPEMMLNGYDMSAPYTSNTNLILVSGLSQDRGTASYDNERMMLYVEVSEDYFQRLLFTNYREFIWSVRSVSRYGQRSRWAVPRRFLGFYELPGNMITVEPVNNIASDRIVTIRGYKHPSISEVTINEDSLNSRYNSATEWESDFLLSGGTNTIYVRGYGDGNRPTRKHVVKTKLTTGQVFQHNLFNVFDEFGLEVGVDRMFSIKETNDNYRDRIEDVLVHPGGGNMIGLHNAICRNLDLDYHDYALKLRPSVIDYERSDQIYGPLYIDITTNSFDIAGTGFKVDNEYHLIDVQDLSIELDNKIDYAASFDSVVVKDGSYEPIAKHLYKIVPEYNLIKFNSYHMAGKPVWISYSKKLTTPIGPDVTLAELQTNIEALTYAGRQIIDVTVASGYDDESSDGLIRDRFSIRGNARFTSNNINILGTPIRWSDISIFQLMDYEYHDRYLNENGNNLNTKIDSFISSFKDKAHLSWDKVKTDHDVWDPIDEKTDNAAHIRTNGNPCRGYWKSSSPTVTGRFSTAHAAEMMFKAELDKSRMNYYGIRQEEFVSGVGRDNDLKVVISDEITKEVLYSPGIYRVTVNAMVTGSSVESRYLPESPIGGNLFTP